MSNSYELINNKEIDLLNKKKTMTEVKAVSYSNELKPEIIRDGT